MALAKRGGVRWGPDGVISNSHRAATVYPVREKDSLFLSLTSGNRSEIFPYLSEDDLRDILLFLNGIDADILPDLH